ncbi:C10 family peptidase [Labilibaculum euxinus]
MKRFSLLFLLFTTYQFSYCQKVDEELARSIASNFYKSLTSESNLKTKSASSIKLRRVDLHLSSESNLKSSNIEGNDPLYVFNIGSNQGFVVVSGYLKGKPILAYSTKGSFPEDEKHPSHLLLNNTIKYVANIKSSIPDKEWEEMEFNVKSTGATSTYLIKSKWEQGGPYNNYLSEYLNVNHMELGCGAIAVAQIMNYYKYPLIGKGNISYNEFDPLIYNPPSYGIVSANFEDEYYDWNLFEDNYAYSPNGEYLNEEEEELVGEDLNNAKAMSKTLFEISASQKTTYGENGGGSDPDNGVEAMETYFNYSEIEKKNGNYISQSNWVNILKNEIKNGRPILYVIVGNLFTGAGHAFICDGYNEDNYFHFNFGWGQYDPESWYWMPIDDITPGDKDYSFNTGFQSRIYINIEPDYVNPDQDKYENDNSFYDATEITNNSTQLHSISPIGDVDYYTFNLSVESDVTIETKGVNGNTQLTLLDETKSWLTHDDDSSPEGGGNAKITYTLSAGKYYFVVDEKDDNETIPSYIVSFKSISLGTRNISFSDYRINDGNDIGGEGDGDGKAESGELIELDVEVYNSGDANAQDVRAVLSTNDPDIEIIKDGLSWGRINPDTKEWDSDSEFKISFSCPTKNVTFTLDITSTSTEENWTETFEIPVYNVPTVYIPDANFEQALIDEEIDTDGVINHQILISDAESVTDDLRLENRNISSLEGLGAFKNIQRLYCEGNQITEIDISENKELYDIRCEDNQLTELNVSKNTKLKTIKCRSNQIEKLDIRNNIKLEYLSCSGNPISSLNVTNNTALKTLNFNNTQLKYINLNDNIELIDLGCDGNKLEELDVSKNTKLTELDCDDNLLTGLDLSQNTSLIKLWCRRNQLIDIIFSQNSTLTILECESNKLKSLDFSKNGALIEVDCSLNELTSLDASNNHDLTDLNCESNQLFHLDMRNGIDPRDIDLRAELNNLTCINIDDENHPDLDTWDVDDGVIFSVDCPKDLDGDGVLYDDDYCHETPLGEQVDSDGCSDSQLDDDVDGVMNDVDQCADTPTGESVNSEGCSESQLDDDSDGVMNDIDQCPNTPTGELVDLEGCSENQLDDDRDGVMNDVDQCADTPTGETVNSEGCSESQLDADADGVMNNLDDCPDTPTGETVNSEGCSESQLDDDVDGVMNDVDQCSDTPTGETVNSEGCSESQLDDDGDGVMNNIDTCPDTPTGVLVNSEGCSESQLDDVQPGVTINTSEKNPTNTVVFELTITSNEEITGFDLTDFSLGNCTASNLQTTNNIEFTVNVEPSNDGVVTVSLPDNAVTDLAGNGNALSNEFSITYDGTAPTVEFIYSGGSPTNLNALVVAIVFSEEVTGFELSHIDFENCTISNLKTTDNIQYTVDVKPDNVGVISLDLEGDMVTDLAGNGNEKAEQWTTVVTGIETLQTLGLNLHPNPVKDYLTVSSSETNSVLIQVLGVGGEVVFSEEWKSPFTNRINFSNYSNGLYLLRFIIDGKVVTHKIILVK